MSPQELNRDIKRLKAFYNTKSNTFMTGDDELYIKKELSRLYYADDKFEYMNKDSIVTLLKLNLKFRAIPLYLFGIQVDLTK